MCVYTHVQICVCFVCRLPPPHPLHTLALPQLFSASSAHRQNQTALQEKNAALAESVTHLRDELRGVDTRRVQLEAELRATQTELADAQRRVATAESSLVVASKVGRSVGGRTAQAVRVFVYLARSGLFQA